MSSHLNRIILKVLIVKIFEVSPLGGEK